MWIFGLLALAAIGSTQATNVPSTIRLTTKLPDVIFLDNDNHAFDVLIFTQQWPVTTCIEWMAHGKGHSCVLPSPKEIWTIHGVWPTRFGTIGPSFCNSSAVFDPTQLEPFKDQMNQFWLNIEKGQSLWQHEWLKHGTCAAVLPQLDNEQKYFGTGLSWLHKYSMSSILAQAKVLPDVPHKLRDIHAAVVGTLQKNPSIHCIEVHSKEVFLSEIRVCFNKALEMVDCDGVKFIGDTTWSNGVNGSSIVSNCNPDADILYPSKVPHRSFSFSPPPARWRFPFVEVYKLLDIVKWLTL